MEISHLNCVFKTDKSKKGKKFVLREGVDGRKIASTFF
jgi:hypothetical protein